MHVDETKMELYPWNGIHTPSNHKVIISVDRPWVQPWDLLGIGRKASSLVMTSPYDIAPVECGTISAASFSASVQHSAVLSRTHVIQLSCTPTWYKMPCTFVAKSTTQAGRSGCCSKPKHLSRDIQHPYICTYGGTYCLY